MDFLASCQIILSLLGNQALSLKDHNQVEERFYQVAPKCKEEIAEAQKKAPKK